MTSRLRTLKPWQKRSEREERGSQGFDSGGRQSIATNLSNKFGSARALQINGWEEWADQSPRTRTELSPLHGRGSNTGKTSGLLEGTFRMSFHPIRLRCSTSESPQVGTLPSREALLGQSAQNHVLNAMCLAEGPLLSFISVFIHGVQVRFYGRDFRFRIHPTVAR